MRKNAKTWVAVNDHGTPIGEGHPRAVLSDHEVELLLELRAEGFTLSWLAAKFEVSKGYVGKVVRGECRAQIPAAFRRVHARRRRG